MEPTLTRQSYEFFCKIKIIIVKNLFNFYLGVLVNHFFTDRLLFFWGVKRLLNILWLKCCSRLAIPIY